MHLKTSNPQSSPSLWKAESNCSEARIAELAQNLALELRRGDRVLLEGPMGVGKTTFARALLAGLEVRQPPEGSPSFAIAHEYTSPRSDVVHMDFYRIRSESEIDDAGIPAYFWDRNLIAITEWLSNWPEFEKQVVTGTSGRLFKIDLNFDANELDRPSRNCRISQAG